MLRRFRLAAAQRFLLRAADNGVAPFAQSELDQFCLQTPGAIAPRQVRRANRRGKQQVFADGEMFVERVLLRHVTDVVFQGVEILIERLPVEKDLAAGGLKLACQHSHERAFSRTARAHHANELTTRDAKGDSLETN